MKRAGSLLNILVLIAISAVLLPPFSGGFEGVSGSTDAREAGSGGDPVVLDARGNKVSFRSYLGNKPLLVVFWATWCPECRAEVPTLNRLASDPSLRVLAVNVGEDEQKVRSFVSTFHVAYPVVRDSGWRTTTAYKIVGIPACILLDKGGEILYRGSGLPGNIEAYLRR